MRRFFRYQISSTVTYNDKLEALNTQERIHRAIMNAMGPQIRDLMQDDSVIEIMLNSDGKLFAEFLGKGIVATNHKMVRSDAETLIRLVASCSGEECNERTPSLASTLPVSAARFQAFVPPVVDSPSFTIRKRATRVFTLDDYVNDRILNTAQKDVIVRAIQEKDNILIVGGTGSGKTTLANAVLQEMAKTNDRIITIEDTAELQVSSENKEQLYTRPEVGFYMQDAVRCVLRFRPDRIVIGEMRSGAVALEVIKSWNTGHRGGCTTIHANSAQLGLKRLESLISEVSVNIPRDLISQTINMIINIKRNGGTRIVDQVVKVTGINREQYEFLTML